MPTTVQLPFDPTVFRCIVGTGVHHKLNQVAAERVQPTHRHMFRCKCDRDCSAEPESQPVSSGDSRLREMTTVVPAVALTSETPSHASYPHYTQNIVHSFNTIVIATNNSCDMVVCLPDNTFWTCCASFEQSDKPLHPLSTYEAPGPDPSYLTHSVALASIYNGKDPSQEPTTVHSVTRKCRKLVLCFVCVQSSRSRS